MRMIDADALEPDADYDDGDYWAYSIGQVQFAPTIEPERKKEKWIVYKAPDKYHCGLVKCPFCGKEGIAEADEYNYCPNCGADMRGNQDVNANA